MNPIGVVTEVQVDLGAQKELYTLERNLIAIHEGQPVMLTAGLVVIVASTEPLVLEDSDANQYFIPQGVPTL